MTTIEVSGRNATTANLAAGGTGGFTALEAKPGTFKAGAVGVIVNKANTFDRWTIDQDKTIDVVNAGY